MQDLKKDKNQTKLNLYKIFIYILSVIILTGITAPKIKKGYKFPVNHKSPLTVISYKNIKIINESKYYEIKQNLYSTLKNVYRLDGLFVEITPDEVLNLNIKDKYRLNFLTETNRIIKKIIATGYKKYNFNEKDYSNGIEVYIKSDIIQIISKSAEELKIYSDKIIIGKKKLMEYIRKNININPELLETAIEFMSKKIQPNFYVDNTVMLERFSDKLNEIKKPFIEIKKNDIVIKKGETVTAETKQILEHFNKTDFKINLYTVIILFFVYSIIYFFIDFYILVFIKQFCLEINNYLITSFLILLPAVITKLYLVIINSTNYAAEMYFFLFLIPIESFAILTVILLFRRMGILISFINVFTATLIFSVYSSETIFNNPGYAFILGFVLFFSSMTGVLFMSHTKKRNFILKSGLYISLTNIVFLFFAETLYSNIYSENFLLPKSIYLIIFFKGLILTPSFVTGLMPFFESLFNITTEYKLMELADISHPLLKKLAAKAPGTYQHSLTVGNLAESAAQSINANPLLARVGAYYHDIGKMIKPEYFIENQNYIKNPHEKIKPSLSNSVLKAHVKNGIELAEKWKLPKPIKDMIQQHHSKSLMLYFYNEALKNDDQVSEDEYRYPGPNPQFKESAILALSDTIEAMTRSLKNPTPNRITELVNKAVKSKINNGDLDESNLTLFEINQIGETFIRILTTMYHTRIEYPDEKEINQNIEKNKKEG